MGSQLTFTVGPHDDEALARAMRFVGNGTDVMMQCGTPVMDRDVAGMTAAVRRRVEEKLTQRTYIHSSPYHGSIRIPSVPEHVAAVPDPALLFNGHRPAEVLGAFIERFGGWYAISQMREADFDALRARMQQEIQNGGDTVGPCYESMLHVTLELLAQALRRARTDGTFIIPGTEKISTDEARLIIPHLLKPYTYMVLRNGLTNLEFKNADNDESVAEFDGSLIARLGERTRVVLFDVMYGDQREEHLSERLEAKAARNNGFLYNDVKSVEKRTFGFMTVAATRGHAWTTDPNVVFTGHMKAVEALDDIMTRSMSGREPDKYLAFRQLVDKE